MKLCVERVTDGQGIKRQSRGRVHNDGESSFQELAGMPAPQAKRSDFRARRSAPRREGGGLRFGCGVRGGEVAGAEAGSLMKMSSYWSGNGACSCGGVGGCDGGGKGCGGKGVGGEGDAGEAFLRVW